MESFNGKLRDEFLKPELFNTPAEAKVLIEQWRQHYNTVRPHSSLRYRPPAPEVVLTHLSMPPHGSELQGSLAHRFAAGEIAACGQHLLNHTQAKRSADVERARVTGHLARELVSRKGLGGRDPAKLTVPFAGMSKAGRITDQELLDMAVCWLVFSASILPCLTIRP